jgi:hypothetical protein
MDYKEKDQPTYMCFRDVFDIRPLVVIPSDYLYECVIKAEEFPVEHTRRIIPCVKKGILVYKLISELFYRDDYPICFTAEFSADDFNKIKRRIPKHIKETYNL